MRKYRLSQLEHEEEGHIHCSILGLRGNALNYLGKTGQTGEGASCHRPVWSWTGCGLPRAGICQQPDCCLATTHCPSSLWWSCLSHSWMWVGESTENTPVTSPTSTEGPGSAITAHLLPGNLSSQLTPSIGGCPRAQANTAAFCFHSQWPFPFGY